MRFGLGGCAAQLCFKQRQRSLESLPQDCGMLTVTCRYQYQEMQYIEYGHAGSKRRRNAKHKHNTSEAIA